VLEAQACGTPVVGAPISPLADLKEAGAGVELSSQETAASLAATLHEMLEDRRRLADLSAKARCWAVEHLRPGPAIERLLGVYLRVVEQ
jgi:glycosyltransferase involved in cell wall biosynthesis